ncbi:MAG TPA: metallopeptidase TldD-related protein [Gemmatimonadales bacterium]|nr:metallopeptidase TldD-related protein [Gemmatimonadales bacterium]
MIGRILERLAARVSAADTVVKADDTLSLAISADGDSRATSARSRTTHLRLLHDGRVGHAWTSGEEAEELIERAFASAGSGGALELLLPAPAPLPEVVSRAPHAAAADVVTLDRLARALFERLQHSGRRVEVWAERAVGSVQVANTRGVHAGYQATLAGVGAVVESLGAGWAPPCRVRAVSVVLPELPDIERLVSEVETRLSPPLLDSVQLPAAPAVCLAPRAAATFLRPLRAALLGYEAWLGSSPLRGRLGDRLFDEKLSLTDDPLAPGRPASRPIDDDGVVSRRVPLIERGRPISFLADLEIGARAQVPSTGHAWRTPSAASRVGFTNLRITPGIESRATLLTMMGRGLLIEDLEWGGGPNPLTGTLALRAPWCYLVEGGVVRGRIDGVLLSGNVFKALAQLPALGSDATWIGALYTPSMLVEGLTVAIKA